MSAQPHAVLLARFSPRPREQDCDSCDVQLADMIAYCAREGLTVRSTHRDDALSGKGKDSKRKGLRDALESVKRGDVLIVRDFDRLSRDTYARLGYMVELTRRGVKLLSLTEGEYKPADKESKLLFGILAATGEYRRDCVRESTKAKMLQHQRAGRLMGGVPYGWDEGRTQKVGGKTQRTLVANPDEQLWIVKMTQWRDNGIAPDAIAKNLNFLRVPTKRGKASWTNRQVSRVLLRGLA